jgi:8-oxo-dGTP diphosphatase
MEDSADAGGPMTQHLYRKQHVVTSVVAVIVDEAERVLLTRRAISPFLGMWVMPGGKIDVGEPILAALHREVREEVGIAVTVEGLVDVFEHLTPDTDHFVILYYRCQPVTRELWPNAAEVAEARWVPRAELGTLGMTDGSRFILGKLFPELPPAAPRAGDGESGEG